MGAEDAKKAEQSLAGRSKAMGKAAFTQGVGCAGRQCAGEALPLLPPPPLVAGAPLAPPRLARIQGPPAALRASAATGMRH